MAPTDGPPLSFADRLLWALLALCPPTPRFPWLELRERGPAPDATPDPDAGLLPSLQGLAGPTFDPSEIDAFVQTFYVRTARYGLDVHVAWRFGFRHLGGLWTRIWARRWGQLELPMRSGETLTNELIPSAAGTWWFRRYVANGATMYRSLYAVASVASETNPCVSVHFPIPGGAAVVLFRAHLSEAGGLDLVEDGGKPGGPGLYLIPHDGPARYVRALRESIEVRRTATGLCATHRLAIFGLPFLQLRYDITAAAIAPA